MWPSTSITQLLGINLPIIQAPMAGGPTTPELIAAVSNAGGMGSLGAGYLQPDVLRENVRAIKALTDKPFAVNLFIPESYETTPQAIKASLQTLAQVAPDYIKSDAQVVPPYTPDFDAQFQVLCEEGIPVFSSTFGLPSKEVVTRLKSQGTIVIGTVTNVAEAQAMQAQGIDAISVQGSEAGGHRGTFIGNPSDSFIATFALLPQVCDHVDMPVIAAGGIMDARGIMAARYLGAAAVQMGSAFLCCPEAGTHPLYKQAILDLDTDNTRLTIAFSGRYARAIKNNFTEAMLDKQESILPFPVQNKATKIMRQAATANKDNQYMAMWAGQGAYLARVIPAAELVTKLDDACRQLLSTTSSTTTASPTSQAGSS